MVTVALLQLLLGLLTVIVTDPCTVCTVQAPAFGQPSSQPALLPVGFLKKDGELSCEICGG